MAIPDKRSQNAWKLNAPAGRTAKPAERRGPARWFVAAAVVLALGGAIVGLLTFVRPPAKPVLLALAVTQYSHPDWPPNPFAEPDAAGFRERFGADSASAVQVQERGRILRELNQIADDSRGTAKGRPVVVYLSALGTVQDGVVYFFPGDARPGDPTTWLPLDEVLAPLRRTDGPRLLVLDLRPVMGVRTVLPAEDANEALDAALAKLDAAGDLPFFVLNANTPAAGPNLVRPLKRSVFGVSLAQAAGGAADRWNAGRSSDGQVSVAELAGYVRDATAAGATAMGLPPQVPKLHGKGQDFSLLPVPSAGPAALPTPGELEEMPAWLADAWKERDAWKAEGIHRRIPRLYRQLQQACLRAETHWLAGSDPKPLQDELASQLADLRKTKALYPAKTPPAYSIARVEQANGGRVPKLEEVTRSFPAVFNRIKDLSDTKPETLLLHQQELWTKPTDATPWTATAEATLRFVASLENPTWEQIRAVATTLRGFKPTPQQPELLPIFAHADSPPELTKRWPREALARWLAVSQSAEECAALDGQVLPWIRSDLASLDAKVIAATEVLLNPESPESDLARASETLEAARRSYDRIRDEARGLSQKMIAVREAESVLFGIVDGFPQTSDSGRIAGYGIAVALRRVLPGLVPQGNLRLPEGAGREALELESESRPPPLGPRTKEATLRECERDLQWPGREGIARQELVKAMNRLAAEAAQKCLANWPTLPLPDPAPTPPQTPAVKLAAEAERTRGLALANLALGRFGNVDTSVPLRSLLVERIPEAFGKASPTDRALIGWAVDPKDVSAIHSAGDKFDANPEAVLQRDSALAFQHWLADNRYGPGATALRGVGTKAAVDASARLEAVRRELLDWSP